MHPNQIQYNLAYRRRKAAKEAADRELAGAARAIVAAIKRANSLVAMPWLIDAGENPSDELILRRVEVYYLNVFFVELVASRDTTD